MRGEAKRYLMVAAGTIAYLFMGFMYVWSVIRLELAGLSPEFTASQLSLNFTLMMAFFCLGGFFGGRLTERKTPALSLRLGVLLMGVGYICAGFMELTQGAAALAVLYIFYAGVAGFGTGMAFNACMCNISPWFPGHVGLVTGIMLMGFGLSSFLLAFVIEAVCPLIGVYNIMRLAGLLIAAAALLASCFVKKPPQPPADGTAGEGVTPRKMVASASFWIYFAWNTVCSGAGLLVINNAANIADYFGLAASLGLVVSVFNGCGRPLVGAMVDRLGQFRSMLTMVLLLIASALLLLLADRGGSVALMFCGMIIIGVVYGGGGTVSSKVICDMYGQRYFGMNHSVANFCVIPSSFLGPYISGILQDCSGGGFTSTFGMLLLMGLVDALLLLALLAAVKRERKNKFKISIDN